MTISIAYFGHNRRDTAFVRRIQSFLDAGASVTTFTFRRDGEPEQPGPPWPNVDLGHVAHAQFFKRLFFYLSAIRNVLRQKDNLLQADVVYARNLDIFLFAMLARRLSLGIKSSNQKIVYECLDVHEALTKPGLVAKVLRWLERRVLSRADLLVVSSPGFIKNYFEPVQGFTGNHIWVENKLYFGSQPVSRPSSPQQPKSSSITIGWIGVIRCQRTLDLLKAAAKSAGSRLQVRIAGIVSDFLIEDFDGQIESHDNISFVGPYAWPHGLAEVYRGVDLVWAQELSWSGHNSDWLIPNRVYEASYFGVPSVALSTTQTGAIIEQRRLGYVLSRESHEELLQLLNNLDSDQLHQTKTDLLSRPVDQFVASSRDVQALLDTLTDRTQARIQST